MEVSCGNCGCLIQRRPSSLTSKSGLAFCSKSCAASFNNVRHGARNPRKGVCKSCKASCSTKSRFCSAECRSSFYSGRTSEQKAAANYARVRTHHRNVKQRAVEYKGGKCLLCGYSRSPWALVFHHVDPSQKDFSISSRSVSWDRVKNELDKCVLLCQNCHAEVHHGVSLLPSALGADTPNRTGL